MAVYIFIQPFLFVLLAQNSKDSIQEREVSEILDYLSSDNLKGRGNFTPELITAGDFIASKFRQYGLQPVPGDFNFYQPFNAGNTKNIYSDNIKWNGKVLDKLKFIYLCPEILPANKTLTNFNIIEYTGAFTDSILLAHWFDTTNTLIWWNQPLTNKQKISLENFRNPGFPPLKSILFVSSDSTPYSLQITVNEEYKKNVLFNIIGFLPGKTRLKEIIIFSAHYDHIGSTKSSKDGIYNGANDDASGTTALLMLAKYFSLRNDNERSILFCAFSGEELGLLGSIFLSSMIKPTNIKAMINIEMIGKTNIGGNNSLFITGGKYSNLEKIMKENLQNNQVKIDSDPGEGNLFRRSDNFPFALKGIPAHTVMCSDDDDPCYHKTCDEAKDIDISNMTRIIKAIAVSTLTIISGKDTPGEINLSEVIDLLKTGQ
jgi:hypothetical protein